MWIECFFSKLCHANLRFKYFYGHYINVYIYVVPKFYRRKMRVVHLHFLRQYIYTYIVAIIYIIHNVFVHVIQKYIMDNNLYVLLC